MSVETKNKEVNFQESFGWYSLILIRAWVYTSLLTCLYMGYLTKPIN